MTIRFETVRDTFIRKEQLLAEFEIAINEYEFLLSNLEGDEKQKLNDWLRAEFGVID